MVNSSHLSFPYSASLSIFLFGQNAFVDSRIDTRNVVEVLIYVFVTDIQDTPPFFVRAPPVTVISDSLEIVMLFLAIIIEIQHNNSYFL